MRLKVNALFLYLSLVCVSAQLFRNQYQPTYYNPKPYPYRYDIDYNPCRASSQGCGQNVQQYPCWSCWQPKPVSQCKNLPCYGQYGRPQQPQLYFPQTNQAADGQTKNFYENGASYDPYANVPVEIIDEENVSTELEDEYANVPVEIIDEDDVGQQKYLDKYFLKGLSTLDIPLLSKAPKTISSSKVSGGHMSSSSDINTKPINVVISKIFEPEKQQESFTNLNFHNGEPMATTVHEDFQSESGPDESTTKSVAVENNEDEEETNSVTNKDEDIDEADDDEESPEPLNNWLNN